MQMHSDAFKGALAHIKFDLRSWGDYGGFWGRIVQNDKDCNKHCLCLGGDCPTNGLVNNRTNPGPLSNGIMFFPISPTSKYKEKERDMGLIVVCVVDDDVVGYGWGRAVMSPTV